MGDFKETALWRSTLAAREGSDEQAEAREVLRTSYLAFRDRAAELAEQIASDFPELTDHGINHLDALWEIADLIAGPGFELNPAEAFVFGGTVLLHDLGLATAAYPDGRSTVESGDDWSDAIALVLLESLGHQPSEEEIAAASEEEKLTALKAVLRKRHADQAEELALISWRDPKKEEEIFLLDNQQLRKAFGRTIGRIARSHWWSVGDLPREFPNLLAAPVSLPNTWTVDQVKVASLLRTADAAHLDARRAPELLRAVRPIGPASQVHWDAQAKIHQPIVSGDRLEYTAGEPFQRDEAQAWWFCLGLLKNADRELREVDALLEDSGRGRLCVNGVRGVDDPQRMATFLRTEGWLPVDAVVHISDVNRIVEHLGGEQLYGRNAGVGVRELIQNAIDAVRARRELENLAGDWGKITVGIGEDEHGHWIEVVDTGIGMSPDVMTGVLLDFGDSLWRSPDVTWELPGLAGRGFQSIGRFGIGFFSVFMLGERVRVTSRRFDRGHDETNVLEFSAGIDERPLMRQADGEERLHEGGTSVRVWLRDPPESDSGILARWGERPPMTLGEFCAYLAPACPVDLDAVQEGKAKQMVAAEDWKSLEANELLRRLAAEEDKLDDGLIEELARRLRTLSLEDGTVVGRACIAPIRRGEGIGTGAVVVGGLRTAPLGSFTGLLVGEVLVAARNYARPVVPASVLAAWATEQGKLWGVADGAALARDDIADVISRCGGKSGPHPIALARAGGLSSDEAVAWIREKDEIFAIGRFTLRENEEDGEVKLDENVLAIENSHMAIISSPYQGQDNWPEDLFPEIERYRTRGCDWKIAKACCAAWGCEPDELETSYEQGRYGTFRGGPMSSSGLLRIRCSSD